MLPEYIFTQEDIEDNRAGVLSTDQRQFLEALYITRRLAARRMRAAFLIWFAVLIVAGTLLELSRWPGSLMEFVVEMGPLLALVSAGLCALLFVVGLIDYILSRDVRLGRISRIEGQVSVLIKEAYARGPYMCCELRIGRGLRRKLFRFTSDEVLSQFEDGRRYRMYFIRYYRLVLSGERL